MMNFIHVGRIVGGGTGMLASGVIDSFGAWSGIIAAIGTTIGAYYLIRGAAGSRYDKAFAAGAKSRDAEVTDLRSKNEQLTSDLADEKVDSRFWRQQAVQKGMEVPSDH